MINKILYVFRNRDKATSDSMANGLNMFVRMSMDRDTLFTFDPKQLQIDMLLQCIGKFANV